MTLKELLDKVSELCNNETKDLPVKSFDGDDYYSVRDIRHFKLKNDFIEINEIRLT